MAMNRNMTMAEKEVRDYAQRQMERAEQRENILFTEEQKEQVLEYAAMTGDDYDIRKMVRDLATALRSSNEKKVDEILWNAREEIDGFPDRSVGMAELKGYGYTANDMFPIRQDMALELHRIGEKVYCLQSDGTHGDYASREMILEHEGLYGIEKDAWQRMQEQEDEIDFEEAGLYQPPMTDIERDEALRMFDAGEAVFLVTTYPRPIAVRERMEIERGPEYYQMEIEDVERIRSLEKRMQEYPQITSLKEANLLLGTENRYGIYQIIDGSPGREYEFMDLNFIERHGYQVKKEDYELIYSDKMLYGDTLDSLYEKFNIAHPEDYTGHSLSVSDIVVLNENGNVKSYFVDSISFRELPDFLQLEPELNQEELAYRIGDQFFAIQVATEGYDYSFYDKEYKLVDGGILDNPDISMREAVQDILEDEGLDQLERIPVDYDELHEKAKEVEAEILQEARSQRKRVPVISDHRDSEAGLNGMSRSEIEETVWAIAQAEIMENDLDARIQAVRVYGSRTRDGLYNEESDVDVVIAYEGTAREDDLFSVLNEAGYKVGNMRVDMNPIRPDKTGTLEDFLEKSERYLDEKTEQIKALGEYKPLAKVEELEEANYNMIDNILNNMPPKKEPYLEYYAAECDEYHSLGKIYKSTNLDEILAKYRDIIDDPTLSYYGNGMGIIYRDPNDTFYDEAEVSLVSRKSIRGDSLDDVAFLAALPMVHEALEKIVEAFPDFRYYPPKELNVHYYPEKMTADELAAALDRLAEDFDHYDYHDNFSPEEDMVETVALELRCGYAHKYIPFLKDIIDEECEESPRAEELLEKLKAYQPEIPETAVPVVRINFCEDKEMDISGYQKLGSLDEITAKMDADMASKVDPSTGMPEKTVQMYFTIYYPDHNQMQELKGKINIGDGNGGIVSQLKSQNEMKLHDESWMNYQKAKGEESFQAYMADLTDMQEHVLPYLQSFCSLEERAPERSVEPTAVSQSEMEAGKTITSLGNEKSKTVESARKSIHERLKINKEIIAKQQGKDSKEKGVELA
ncbi:YodL domain-containing protein [Ruminococcus sp. 5_1_39BFAA]|uniref:YodL domain-containing protein n=1 Tax=Ruminococcus sp. 5_1_39BFAA TaxID=457412 RepID=UPI00356712A6